MISNRDKAVEETNKRCDNCEGSGIATIPDATGDDYEYAYCYCFEGKRAEECNAMQVLQVKWYESEGSPRITKHV